MTDLPYEQHRRLINVLKRIHLFQNQEGRSLLLIGLSMVTGVERSSVRETDLNNIVSAVARWGTLTDGKPALVILFNNARDAAGESTDGYELEALQAEFTTSEIPAFRTLSPIERAERYRQLKAAYEAGEDQRVLDLAVGIDHDHNVPQLVTHAREKLNNKRRLMEELSDAYATDEWAQVIKLARQFGAQVPSQVSTWVAHAWREIPVQERVLTGHAGLMAAVVVTPDGHQALSGSADKTLRLWHLPTGECVRTFIGHTGFVNGVAVTQDGQLAISSSGSGDGTLRLWNLASGECVRTFEGHTGVVTAVATTPDGRMALSGARDKTIRLWDLATGECIRIFEGHDWAVFALAITADGRQVLSGAGDRTLRLWDIATGECIRTFIGHTGSVTAVGVTQNGRQALSGSGSGDGTLRLWNLASGECVRTFEGHTGVVTAVVLTPNGKQAISGSRDGTLRLWDLLTGQELRTLTGHKAPVFDVALTPDGRDIVFGGEGLIIRVWTLPEGLLG